MSFSRRLIIIGAIALAAGLIVTFPARIVHQWFAPEGVRLSGISGSIWRGRAAEGVVNGIYVRNLGWQLHPLSLFTGQLAYSTELELSGGFAEGDIGVTPTGRIALRDFNATLPLAAFDRALRLQGLAGDLSLQVARADIDNGWPVSLQGNVAVSNLLIRALASTPLGSYRAEFQTTDEAITGSVEDTGGVLELAGTLRLTPERNYSLIGRVGATVDAPDSVTQQLRFLGTPDARGLREFRFEGAL